MTAGGSDCAVDMVDLQRDARSSRGISRGPQRELLPGCRVGLIMPTRETPGNPFLKNRTFGTVVQPPASSPAGPLIVGIIPTASHSRSIMGASAPAIPRAVS